MRFRLKKIVIVGLAAALGWATACEKSAIRTERAYTSDDTAVETGREVEILYSDSSIVRVRVTASIMRHFTDPYNPRQVFPEGIKVEFLDATTATQSVLTAKTAVREAEKGRVTARDSVVMRSVKGEMLETEELIWDEKTEKLRTDKFVKVTQPGEIIYGFGLEANQDFSYWRILAPKGRIKAEQVDEALKN